MRVYMRLMAQVGLEDRWVAGRYATFFRATDGRLFSRAVEMAGTPGTRLISSKHFSREIRWDVGMASKRRVGGGGLCLWDEDAED